MLDEAPLDVPPRQEEAITLTGRGGRTFQGRAFIDMAPGFREGGSTRPERAITRLAEGAADRETELRDAAIEAIDEAITKFRSDLRATKQVVLADGSVVEEPAVRITPRDLALLIDRLQVLFGRPALISEGRGFTASIASEVPIDVLRQIVELTRGLGTPATDRGSGLPHVREKVPD